MGSPLSLQGVGKSYRRRGTEVRVLRDVTLEVHAGELAAVWGTRRSGKTTLLKLAARLETPDSGSVYFEGVDLATLSERQHGRLMLERIGWIQRVGPMSDLRMLDYVALPLLVEHGRRHAYARAEQALERVGLSAQARLRWGNLCGMERALIGIAHGIVRSPRLLLVDDLTAELDVLERERITELLHSLAQEQAIAVLMAVPEMSAAMRADRIFSLGGGRLGGASMPPRLPSAQLGLAQVIHLRDRQ